MKRIQRDNEYKASIGSQRNISIEDNNNKDKNNEQNFEEEQEFILQRTKPILKKNLTHFGNNVILMFKSIEIFIIKNDQDGKEKINDPIYVPISQSQYLLKMRKEELVRRIMKNLRFNNETKTFQYKSNNKENKSKKEINSQYDQQSNDEYFPDDVQTELFQYDTNKDFKVVISFPKIEYQIPSKQFNFIKPLSRFELADYLDQTFLNWDQLLLKHLMQFRKFIELLKHNTIGNDNNNNGESMNIYYLQEKNGFQIQKYSSIQQYRNEKLLKQTQSLQGCFDKDNQIGNIELKSFALKIRGLNNSIDIVEEIKTSDWQKVINYMKTQVIKEQENPKQLVDKIQKKIQSCNNLGDFTLKYINLNKYQSLKQIEEKGMNLQRKKQITQFFKSQKKSKMISITRNKQDEKYLIEIEFPTVTVYYNEQQHRKTLSEEDCIYLTERNFSDWKKYIMNQHFRLELNIGSNQPLPRIIEDKRGEDELLLEEKIYLPTNEEEKRKIDFTRGRLSQWFPY